MLITALLSILTVVALPKIKITPTIYMRTVSLMFLISSILTLNMMDIKTITTGVSIYSGLFEVTTITIAADAFIFISASLVIIPWAPKTINYKIYNNKKTETQEYLKNGKMNTTVPTISEYGIIVIFSTVGASFLLSSGDLVSIFLSIELQSFGVYILATIYRDSITATDSGLKYFLLGSLSSCFILLGSGILYSYTGLTNIEGLITLITVSDSSNITITIAVIIIITGYLFKISAAPLHNWSPDVYDGVPTIVTTWLSTIPKLSILVFIIGINQQLGINYITNNINIEGLQTIILVSSVLSLIIGTIVGLAQTRIKRLLAYSTISHIGFILLALAVNSEEGIESYLLYISQYTLTAINGFFVVLGFGYIWQQRNEILYIKNLSGLFILNPAISLSLAVSLFSIAGVPPIVGFFAKQSVLYAAIHTNHTFIAIVGIVVSVISASYYLKIIRVIHFDNFKINEYYNNNNNNNNNKMKTNKMNNNFKNNIINQENYIVSNIHAFIISLITLTLTLYIFNSSLVLDSISILALNLYNS